MQSDAWHESLKKWQTSYEHLIYAVVAFRDAYDDLLQATPQSKTSYIEKAWVEEALSQLRGNIDDLEDVEGKLAQSRMILHRTTNSCAAFVPINGLPTEILSRIFTAAALPLVCAPRAKKLLEQHPLFVISSVCTRWRELAIGTRSLWSHIWMDEDFVSQESNEYVRRLIELRLNRSNGAPLSLRFEKERPAQRVVVDQITLLLRSRIVNVTSLVFYKSSDVLFDEVLALYGDCFPSTPLTTLVVHAIQVSAAAPTLTWPMHNLRSLRTLALSGFPALFGLSLGEIAQIL
ncbi:hypothetical protein FRC07_012673, partial [Ceratobasidium sp. 392]